MLSKNVSPCLSENMLLSTLFKRLMTPLMSITTSPNLLNRLMIPELLLSAPTESEIFTTIEIVLSKLCYIILAKSHELLSLVSQVVSKRHRFSTFSSSLVKPLRKESVKPSLSDHYTFSALNVGLYYNPYPE